MQVQKSLDKLLIGNIQYKVKQGRIRQKLQFDIIIMITIGISWFTWGWRGILIWLRMMHWTRHPGPLMKRRQILARLIIISPSLFYSSLFLSIGIRTYCLLLLSGVPRSSELYRGSQGRVWSLDLGRDWSSVAPPSSDAGITWIRAQD